MTTSQVPGTGGMDQTDQVRALEAEVARLRGQLDAQAAQTAVPAAAVEAKAPRAPRHWARNALSVFLIVLACLLAPLSVVAVWARGEVTDTDRYVATVAPLASDPAIQAAVSKRVTEEVLTAIDVKSLTDEAVTTITDNRQLNPKQTAALTTLGGALDSGIQSYIGSTVAKVVASDQFKNLWTQANTELHTDLNAALTGTNTGSVKLVNDQIVLNVGDVVAKVKDKLIAEGFSAADKIPTVNTTVVLYQSNSLARIQNGYNLLNTVGYWLPIVLIVLALIGVFTNTNPRKALIGLGIGLALTMLLGGVAYLVLRAEVLNQLPPDASAAAATALLDQISYYLRQGFWAGAFAGVVFALAGLFSGPSRFATGVRGLADRGAGALQRQITSWGVNLTPVTRFVSAQATGLRIAVALIAVAVIMLQRYKTVELIVWTVVGLLVALFIIQVLASRQPVADAEPQADAEAMAESPQTA